MERVCEGYGILQPRVGASLPGANRSRYARLFGSEPGIDPYTRAVSDVYQDLFGEGSFIGKGIYDVDAFERALKGRFPDNRILSHDLLEGCYARSGLLSDVQLYEEYPARYSADVSRRHRWIRGDWQLLRWLLPRVPGADGTAQQSDQRAVALEALRQPSAQPGAGGADAAVPVELGAACRSRALDAGGPRHRSDSVRLIACLLDLLRKPTRSAVEPAPDRRPALRRARISRRLPSRWPACRTRHTSAWTRSCAPSGGWWSSRRRLLEWSASSEADGDRGNSLAASWRTMWIGPALALGRADLPYGRAAQRACWWPGRLGAVGAVAGHRLVDQPALCRGARRA